MSRRVNKERTRRRLLQGVIKIIYRQGHGALTTGRVAQLAGVAQPTFYVHFKSMEEALEQVCDWVAGELSPAFTPELVETNERTEEVLTDALRGCIRALVRDRKVAEVFLRSRRDPTSPMGLRWMALTEGFRDRMEQVVRQVGPTQTPLDARIHSELLVGSVFAIAEALLDRRVSDVDRASRAAARAVIAGINSPRSVADAA